MAASMNAYLNRLTLVIVTWKGDELVRDCLDSIVKVYGRLPPTVLVDNAALASTRALAAEYAGVTYLPQPDNLGFAGGNCAAWPLCDREYVVLLNNDTRLTDDSLSPLVEFMDAHPACAAAQGKIVLAANGKLDGCGGFFSPLGVLAFRGQYADEAPEFDEPMRVAVVGGAFFIVRREAVNAAGGIFHAHFKSYYEEIDLCCRLGLAGHECWYVPTPAVLHLHSVTASKFGWEKILPQYYRNIGFSLRTCFGRYGRLRIGLPLKLLSFAQCAVALLKGNAGPVKAHRSAAKALRGDAELICETRDKLRANKTVSDREFLSFAIRSQPWRYYLALARRG